MVTMTNEMCPRGLTREGNSCGRSWGWWSLGDGAAGRRLVGQTRMEK